MTILDDILAVVRADAEALEHAIHEGRLDAGNVLMLDTEAVTQIAVSMAEGARVPGGVPALVAADYADDPLAFCTRMRTALRLSARLHGATALVPMLTATNIAHLPAVRVERGWALLDLDTWRRVTAEPELLGDGLDDDGGRVELLLDGRGPVAYRRGERVWARDAATHAAALETADRLAEALLAETMGEDHDG